MKYILYVLAIQILCIACGSDDSPQVIAGDPAPSAIPAPIAKSDDRLIGNWIDASSHTLTFNQDGTGTLDWSLSEDSKLIFSSAKTEVDRCSYAILTSGGLTATLIITLDLACDKAGQITYTKQP